MVQPTRGRNQASASADPLHGLLSEIAHASGSGNLNGALRLADRARRIAPGQPTVAQLYARLLAQLGRADAALASLPDKATLPGQTLRIELLLDLQRIDEALTASRDLLRRHAIDELPGLPALLDRACEAAELPGWVAVLSSLQLVGHCRPGARLAWQQGSHSTQLPRAASAPQGWVELQLPRPEQGPDPIQINDATGVLLLGAPLDWPPDFRAAGWVIHQGPQLIGEVELEWAQRLPRQVIVRHQGHVVDRVSLAPRVGAEGPLAFSLALEPEWQAATLEVALECPDGRTVALLGSPASLAPALPARSALLRAVRPERSSGKAERPQAPVDIIVPVYRGREETLRCLDSVLATVPRGIAELVVIDDASPDSGLSADLQAMASAGRITLLVNPHNLGFPASVNRGLALHPERDAVLLNADCAVFGDWLNRLAKVAYSAADIATVTPLGRSATILSYPAKKTATTDAAPADSAAADAGAPLASELDTLAAQANAGRSVEIPVGVGFCLYIRRACLQEVGVLDGAAFGRGYGEEGDFCLRASQAGWRHLAATEVYVEHVGGRSFGTEAQLWLRRNRHVINARHPDYDRLVEAFVARDALHEARRALDLARLHALATQTTGARTLLLSLALPGGVARHVRQRIDSLEADGGLTLLLRPVADQPGRVQLELRTPILHDLQFDWPRDADLLTHTLTGLGFTALEVHHFLDLPAGLVDVILRLGVPYTVSLHDHAWICPRLTLTGGDKRYCGEPDLAGCEACITQHGSELEAGLSVRQLRARSERWLSGARKVLAPSKDLEQRYQRHFPRMRVSRRAWEAPMVVPNFTPPAAGERTRVLILGAVSEQKGYHVLLDCAQQAASADLPIEFVLVGYSEADGPLLDTGRVFITGPYVDAELDTLLDREACHLAWFPSVAPETWCYALSHAMRRGMPIAGFDLGAIGERLKAYRRAHLLPLESTIDAVLDSLFEAGGAPARVKSAPVSADQADAASSRPGQAVFASPKAKKSRPDKLLPASAPPTAPETARDSGDHAAFTQESSVSPPIHNASVQPLVLPEGIYAFSVPPGGAAEHPDVEGLMRLPAIGVGPAPTAQTGQVDLFPAPGTVDRWLTRPGDQITVRISGGQAMLLLNSVRRLDAPALAIDVHRLDQKLEMIPTEDQPSLQTLLHVQWLGDLYFSNPQAGPLGHGLGVEALVVDCRDAQGASLAEYRAATADGFETPWLTDGMLCGSRGRGVALLAFAIRSRVTVARRYQFRYRGYFRGAGWQDWCANGDWCRSPHPRDPIEGIEITVEHQTPLAG